MTYRGRAWDMDVAYWSKLAKVTTSRPLWPRICTLTNRMLWLRPCVRGESSYYMRSGSKRYDIRWADPKAFTEFSLRGKLDR
jgi:hypothetical protein